MDPYEVLGVERGSREDVITTAYHKLARQYHPDRYAAAQPALLEIAQSRMADINIAYEILTDPEAARRHRHSEIRREAATQGRQRQQQARQGTVFATSADTAAPGVGAGTRPSPPSRSAPATEFDYRRDAYAEFSVTDDEGPRDKGPTSEPWTSAKPGKGRIFRRK